MVSYILASLTILVLQAIQTGSEETKRILASDPNYGHSLELSVQDLKQQYETSNAHLTAELDAQRTLTSHLVTELDAQRALTSQLTSKLQAQMQMTSELEKQQNNSKLSMSQMTADLQAQKTLTSKLTSDFTKLKQKGHGGTYVRWGRKTCPGNSTELVYSGFAGGSWYEHPGGAANYVCLPSDPQWYSIAAANTGGGKVYGAEYDKSFDGSATINDDVPCCVCRPVARGSVLMIPGRTSCYQDWHTEYQGYLASGWFKAASEYVCLDKNPEAVFGGHDDKNGRLFEDVAAECGSLPCPPYFQGRRMTCVICSK